VIFSDVQQKLFGLVCETLLMMMTFGENNINVKSGDFEEKIYMILLGTFCYFIIVDNSFLKISTLTLYYMVNFIHRNQM
jgi:hypothetical protein